MASVRLPEQSESGCYGWSAAGFYRRAGGGATPAGATLRGRVFLDLCGELQRQVATGQLNPEILQILRLLELRYAPSAMKMASESLHIAGRLLTDVPEMLTARLLATITAATERWGIEFHSIDHVPWRDEEPIQNWGAVQPLVERLREESRLYSE